jgi:S-adenosylmethionine:tRNA ribosyltransferase-isomerase
VRLDDFDYTLPQELIAQFPAPERAGSRLLHLDGRTGALADRRLAEIVDLVAPGDVMVFNDTRVMRARLAGRKQSGGRIEIMVERVLGPGEVLAQIGANHPTRVGSRLVVAGAVEAVVLGRERGFFHLRLEGCDDVFVLMERHGSMPLPMYIEREPGGSDEERYQTVYARERGAVAAPTAGLHFDEPLMAALGARRARIAFVTLHVGAGTFQPVRTDDVAQHEMHGEWYRVPGETVAAVDSARRSGGRVLAVGTTTLRALESAAAGGKLEAGAGETKLFILPGYRFRVVDRLLTNFHLPRSTLLMLVSAFGGKAHIDAAYRHAIERRYRFYSYGDAMLIERQ